MPGVHPAEPRKPSASEAVLWASMIALIFAPLERAIVEASAAEYCPDIQTEIQTDRPDVTKSSFVVPSGSLQTENGISLTAYRVSRIIDGTNSRIRLGVAHCTELLVDVPDYFHSVHCRGQTGLSDVAPAANRSFPLSVPSRYWYRNLIC